MKRVVIRACRTCEKLLYEDEVQELSNARGFGYYIVCPECKTTNVIQEIDLTREIP